MIDLFEDWFDLDLFFTITEKILGITSIKVLPIVGLAADKIKEYASKILSYRNWIRLLFSLIIIGLTVSQIWAGKLYSETNLRIKLVLETIKLLILLRVIFSTDI